MGFDTPMDAVQAATEQQGPGRQERRSISGHLERTVSRRNLLGLFR
ncbi:MAG: hypothetical protein HQL53_13560 [Magnetococcales bacterium]|nr:hypothetical protein [Magnetococcales bacterium]